MRAVFATLNARYVHAATAPFCLLAGLSAYAGRSHTATVIEGTVNEPTEAVAGRILSERPELLALSVYIWNRRETAALIRALRSAAPGLYIAVGGPEVEHDAVAFLTECPADAVLCGEGERQIALLCDLLDGGGDPTSAPGSVTLCGGREHRVPPLPPEACPPSAVTDEYLAAARGRIAYLETSRGCPFSCAFCLSGGAQGGVRFFPIERAKREMLALAGAGVRTVKLVDRTFNADRARARELWRFVIAEQGKGIPPGVSFHFEVSGELLTEEDLALLSEAPPGAIRLEIGIQSFRRETLSAVRRHGDPDCLAKVIERLSGMGNLELHIDLIAGLPGEGIAEFSEGFDRAYRLAPSMLQVGFLKLLHGTPMRTCPERYPCTYASEPPYEVISTPSLTPEELAVLHALEGAVDRLYNSGRFSRTLAYLTDGLGISPFLLFSKFGQTVPPHGRSLDEYTDAFFAYAETLPGVVPARLRDLLVTDRMTTVHDHALPHSLYVRDGVLAGIKRRLGEERRAFGNTALWDAVILYESREILVVEYTERDPVTGEFPSMRLSL